MAPWGISMRHEAVQRRMTDQAKPKALREQMMKVWGRV
jgi:hypothetical protein